MASVTICSDFGTPKIKFLTVYIVSPSICHEVMGPDAMILVFFVTPWTVTVSSVHGTLQARILEWLAIPFSRDSSQPKGQIQVFCIAGIFFTI